MNTREALNVMNANPCTAWDSQIFPNLSNLELDAARVAWHAAIYAAALAIGTADADDCPDCEGFGCVECDGPEHRCA